MSDGDSSTGSDAVTATFGEVSLTDTRGDTVAQVTAGAVLATRVDGYPSPRATAGRIVAAAVTGIDEAYTEAGRINVDLLGTRRGVAIRSEGRQSSSGSPTTSTWTSWRRRTGRSLPTSP